VIIGKNSSVGHSCEIRQSLISENSAIAHFNFIGNSMIGTDVNIEAGAITCNHYNERIDKSIYVRWNNEQIKIPGQKFGALIGDHSRIGANAVLSPGTVLPQRSIVGRLELVEQNPISG
jgi:bifunctional N-acetylglucosamine-1-phosphate-uridyltransferase/glucosamine-1-phosphate-acetyltransferase GlmU-like protein